MHWWRFLPVERGRRRSLWATGIALARLLGRQSGRGCGRRATASTGRSSSLVSLVAGIFGVRLWRRRMLENAWNWPPRGTESGEWSAFGRDPGVQGERHSAHADGVTADPAARVARPRRRGSRDARHRARAAARRRAPREHRADRGDSRRRPAARRREAGVRLVDPSQAGAAGAGRAARRSARIPSSALHMLAEVQDAQGGLECVLYHHERWNGTRLSAWARGRGDPVRGAHPRRRRRLDAMTFDRPYRAALTP